MKKKGLTVTRWLRVERIRKPAGHPKKGFENSSESRKVGGGEDKKKTLMFGFSSILCSRKTEQRHLQSYNIGLKTSIARKKKRHKHLK